MKEDEWPDSPLREPSLVFYQCSNPNLNELIIRTKVSEFLQEKKISTEPVFKEEMNWLEIIVN